MKMIVQILSLLLAALSVTAQSIPSSPTDYWKAISFLQGTWEAKATGGQSVSATGSYTFRSELGDHILARHSTSDSGCKGPANFDCDHDDLLYVYQDAPGQSLKAIYFDNEGRACHPLQRFNSRCDDRDLPFGGLSTRTSIPAHV